MKVYIEKKGDFYEIPEAHMRIEKGLFENYPKATDHDWPERVPEWRTDKRDFEIGSAVYFGNVGWTIVEARNPSGSCNGCAMRRAFKCSTIKCGMDRSDKTFVRFADMAVSTHLSTAEYYVLNTRTQRTEVVHPTEESARAEGERIAKKHVGDTLVVLKVVGKAKATATVEWEDK